MKPEKKKNGQAAIPERIPEELLKKVNGGGLFDNLPRMSNQSITEEKGKRIVSNNGN